MTAAGSAATGLSPLPAYALGLGDDALVLAQRLSEWITRAPQIEEDIALGNIALDLIGQARTLLALAGVAEGAGRDEDPVEGRLVRPPVRAVPGPDHRVRVAQLLEDPPGPRRQM